MSDTTIAPPAEAPTPPIPVEAAPDAYISPADAPSWDTLAARFRPIFARIAEGAIERERKRELAYEAVGWLRETGFGAVRIPKFYGGLGATLPQFFRLLLELAEADSNVSHLFRGHFAWLEMRLNLPQPEVHARWFPEVAKGTLFGYAMAEQASLAGNARLLRENGELFVDGVKYYSTGTIYADWIIASVADGAQGGASIAVPVDAPGVTRIDDWDGFGQRLTGSGTTRFDRVKITEDQILRIHPRRPGSSERPGGDAPATPAPAGESATPAGEPRAPGERLSYGTSFLQLVLLTSMAGAARAALREGIAFVLPRTRTFNRQAGEGRPLPKDDPLVQRVVGKVSSLVYSAETQVLALAQHLEDLYQLAQHGKATEADYAATEIKAYQTQQIVIPAVLDATTQIFDVGGASATSQSRQLDRHWRNARTAASHNPAIQRERAIGDYFLNGVAPGLWEREKRQAEAAREAAEPQDPAAPLDGPSAGAP
ncbi:acyl-CoA dehydrogenase family protein [Xylophilus sp.]|uniref:acyl-CoA dehydrogenase family protein n=1 Tax=Xylophilus sp. TaxID=2653893 RepID=UPI0013BD0DE1|nr:acyl-CoA dehydrogenase family protein [Xylophilus sp.]KAF1047554.1 MAG: Dibenzothiophene desulfurization enzyme C [Xylophilus sp.]